ncbi:MAG: hypothetical protein ACRCYU_20655 [Nocardioides sp.]
MQTAAILEIARRSLASDPSLAWKVRELANIADEGARAASQAGTDSIPWTAMARMLRDELGR